MNNLDEKIGSFLISIGILPSFKGFKYIIEAVKIYSEIQSMGIIYKSISDSYATTPIAVERNMRHAFSKIDTSNEKVVRFFGREKLKNKDMIAIISWKLKAGELDYEKD